MNSPLLVDPQNLIRLARKAGFDEAGVARLESLEGSPDARRLREWVARGRHGAMSYMERTVEKRVNPDLILPGARSVLCVAQNYGNPKELRDEEGGAGRVAAYARGRDYHKTFTAKLKALERRLHNAFPGIQTRRYVDTGPVLERLWAERAGIGWRGKHTNLVSRHWGSWLLLGEILLDAEAPATPPETNHCGTCSRCVKACPTGAITGPYELDATRCISYLTIELRGPIPKTLRPLIGDRVFGCDECLEVCPWNRFAQVARETDFTPRPALSHIALAELAVLDEESFRLRFAGTAVMRAKREGLVRNACVALGNSGRPEAVAPLIHALRDPSALVREHAAWALGRISGAEAREALSRARRTERAPDVLETIEEALAEREGRGGSTPPTHGR